MKEFTIPEGTRDLLFEQCKTKRLLQERITNVFDSYGFQEVITPTIEFYQTYHTAFDTLKDEDMFKFFDHNGQILALRMDMTVPIARVTTTRFKDQKPPFRFSYCANVYKVKESFAGKTNEVSDCGIELIGLRDDESDLEIISCAMDVMQTLQQDSYTLEIGNVNFFRSACIDANLNEKQIATLADLIDRKSMSELASYLETLAFSQQYRAFFLELPWMSGDQEMLKAARAYCFNTNLVSILDELLTLSQELQELGYGEHISFDLGKVPRLNYYSGLIFQGYIEGVGTSVLSGGRYDSLLETFGRALPAIGFSVKLDYILSVLKLQTPNKESIRLAYPIQKKMEAMQQAKELRKQYNVILYPDDIEEITVEVVK